MIFNHLQSILFRSAIGLDKLTVRAKGINHPKYSVKPEYACSKHESARPAITFTGEGNTVEVNGVKKELAEPYADTISPSFGDGMRSHQAGSYPIRTKNYPRAGVEPTK